MKKTICLLPLLFLCACSTEQDTPDVTLIPLNETISSPIDGVYRGYYYDRSEEQVAVQFVIVDQTFKDLQFNTLSYRNTDYLASDPTQAQNNIRAQFMECKDRLLNEKVDAMTQIIQTDSTTQATLPVYTLLSALQDGLHRGVYEPIESTVFTDDLSMPDGTYRGFFYDNNIEQVSVHFTVQDNCFNSFTFRALKYGDSDYLAENAPESIKSITDEYKACGDYLIGKQLSHLNDLYDPDIVSSATLNTSPLISAIHNAFNRGVYRMDNNTALIVTDAEDGVYRGTYYDSGLEQIAVEFTVKNNTFTTFTIRGLNYKDGRYLDEDATTVQRSIALQFQQCADHLIHKDLSAVVDLYQPESIAKDQDAVTAATLRSNKMVSAINDAFLRGVFHKIID